MEKKLYPDMGKVFEPAHHLRSVKRGQKFQRGGRRRHHPGLPGDAEFFAETGMDKGNRRYPHLPLFLPKKAFSVSSLFAHDAVNIFFNFL
jgi:hypothetical protein